MTLNTFYGRAAQLIANRRGSSVVEFAIVAPLFIVMIAGATDIGGMLVGRFALNSAVSAGTNYAVINAIKITLTDAADLATKTAAITAVSTGMAQTVTATINKNYTVTIKNGQATTTGSASDADLCYCPTLSGSDVQWGSAMTCAVSCPNGSHAGKFITVTATRTYTPLFAGYSAEAGDVTVTSRAQAQ